MSCVKVLVWVAEAALSCPSHAVGSDSREVIRDSFCASVSFRFDTIAVIRASFHVHFTG